jgi:hypothetical protein
MRRRVPKPRPARRPVGRPPGGRHDQLLAAVVQPGDTAAQLAARLTVEAFGWPAELELEVVAFRELATASRVRAARRFLARRTP